MKRLLVLPSVGTGEPAAEIHRPVVFADGNARGYGDKENTDYANGGDTVIENGIELLRRELGIEAVLWLIFSERNVGERGDPFLSKAGGAFEALAAKILLRGFIAEHGISLDYLGDLAELSRFSEKGRELVSAMKYTRAAVQSGLRGVAPGKRLLLGANYPEEVFREWHPDLVIRLGMKDENMVRTGSTIPPAGIPIVGSTLLSPRTTAEDLAGLIQTAQMTTPKRVTEGFTVQEILGYLNSQFAHGRGWVMLPSQEDLGEVADALRQNGRGGFTLRDGSLVNISGNAVWQIRPSLAQSSLGPGDFDGILAVGQEGPTFFYPDPSQVVVGYNNVFGATEDPAAFAFRVAEVVQWLEEDRQFGGGTRSQEEIDKVAQEREFLQGIIGMVEAIGIEKSASEVADELLKNGAVESRDLATFYAVLAKSWGWSSEALGLKLDTPEGRRAPCGYTGTSFRMCYAPNEEAWQGWRESWERLMEMTNKLMQIVYTADELIDKKMDDSREKVRIVRAITECLTEAVEAERFSEENLPNIPGRDTLRMIAIAWVNFIREVKSLAHPKLYDAWKNDLVELYKGSLREWLIRLGEDVPIPENEQGGDFDLLARADECVDAYLEEVEQTIGAGLTFRTISMALPHDQASNEMQSLLTDICRLANRYFRILNDISGQVKREDEGRTDSVSIAAAFQPQGKDKVELRIHAIVQLKKKADAMKIEMDEKIAQMKDVCPMMWVAMKKSEIATAIYETSHYRTLPLVDLIKLLAEHE